MGELEFERLVLLRRLLLLVVGGSRLPPPVCVHLFEVGRGGRGRLCALCLGGGNGVLSFRVFLELQRQSFGSLLCRLKVVRVGVGRLRLLRLELRLRPE